MWSELLLVLGLAFAPRGSAGSTSQQRRLAGGTLSFHTGAASSSGPLDFTLKSRVYVPYGAGVGFGYGMGAVEKFAYDPEEKYVYTVSEQGYVNVVDLGDPMVPVVMVDLALDLAGMKLTDVAVCAAQRLLFVAHGASDTVSPGAVRMYSTVQRSGSTQAPAFVKEFTVGALPDMISPNHDCTMLAVANEGEGAMDDSNSLVDPAGSVTIIRNPSADSAEVWHVSFEALGSDAELLTMGVHLPLPLGALEYWDEHSAIAANLDFAAARASYTPATNLEPEYLGWSADGSKLFVNLQENSAIVTVGVPSGTWDSSSGPSATRIDALGLKDWSGDGSSAGIDLVDDGACVLSHYAGWTSLRSADAIHVVNVDGVDYVLTANEGDDKEYGDYEEKWKAKDLLNADGTVGMSGATVDSDVLAAFIAQNDAGAHAKRRLTVGSAAVDYSDPSGPVLKALVGFGGRSLSIYRPGDSGLQLVWDSGSSLEKEQCAAYPWAHNGIQDEEFSLVHGVLYNSSSASMQETLEDMGNPEEDGCTDRGDGQPGPCPLGQTIDERSPKDGAAPEAVVTGVACGRLVAVTATEKQGTAFVYDITDVASPELLFVRHLSPASQSLSPELAYESRKLGEIDPECILFLDAESSPSGVAGVLFGGAWSGTMSFWEFECPAPLTIPDTPSYLAESDMLEASVARSATTCDGVLSQSFTLPSVDLRDFNPFLTEDALSHLPPCAGRSVNDVCRFTPAIGSGMNLIGCGEDGACRFVGITDRGPNQDCGDLASAGVAVASDSGKGFPVAAFSPTITEFLLEKSGVVHVQSMMHLKDSSGAPVTGVSNNEEDDTPYDYKCQARVPYDEGGLDTEGIQLVTTPGSGLQYFVICEEYSPSVAVVEPSTGTVKIRYTPVSKPLPDAPYSVSNILSDALTSRRKNRGFEGLACSHGEAQLLCWIFLQSPMLQSSYVHRVVELDMTDPLAASVSAEYVWEGTKTPTDSNGNAVADSMWTNAANKPKDLKVSAAFWTGSKKVAVLERAKSQVLWWELDFANATDVKSSSAAQSTELEGFLADTSEAAYVNTLSAQGISPASKTLIANTATIEGWELPSKQEGFAFMGGSMVTVNDNDFGLEFSGPSMVGVVQLNGACAVSAPSSTHAHSDGDATSVNGAWLVHSSSLVVLICIVFEAVFA